mgnify:CR=1 FL=1
MNFQGYARIRNFTTLFRGFIKRTSYPDDLTPKEIEDITKDFNNNCYDRLSGRATGVLGYGSLEDGWKIIKEHRANYEKTGQGQFATVGRDL